MLIIEPEFIDDIHMLDCGITIIYLKSNTDTVEMGLSKFIVYVDKYFINYDVNDLLHIHVWRN